MGAGAGVSAGDNEAVGGDGSDVGGDRGRGSVNHIMQLRELPARLYKYFWGGYNNCRQ